MKRCMTLAGFPRGQRVIRTGERIEALQSVQYLDPQGELVTMDPKAYCVDKAGLLILARDVWPAAALDNPGHTVFIYYTTI